MMLAATCLMMETVHASLHLGVGSFDYHKMTTIK